MIMVYVFMQATTPNGDRRKKTNSLNPKSNKILSGRGSLRKRWNNGNIICDLSYDINHSVYYSIVHFLHSFFGGDGK